MASFQPDEQKMSRPASLQEKIHCVVYVIDATKISLMSDNYRKNLLPYAEKWTHWVSEHIYTNLVTNTK